MADSYTDAPTDLRPWVERALLCLCFVVPIQTLLPVKTFRPVELALVLAAATCAVLYRPRLPLALSLSLGLGALSVALATAFSAYPLLSLDTGILEVLIPFAVLYVFMAVAPRRDFMQQAVVSFLLGVTVTSLAQITVIWPEMRGIPLFASEFLEMKKNVPLMVEAGRYGYGNTDNYISLWVLVVPLSAGLFYSLNLRWVSAAILLVVAYCGLIVYSRSGLIAVAAALVALAFAGAVVRSRRALFPLAALGVLGAIHIDATSQSYFAKGVTSFVRTAEKSEAPAAVVKPSLAPAASPARKPLRPKRDDSGSIRAQALERGIEIAAANWITGIGYGVYPIAEPTYTAPHSMLLLRFAEGGILGLLSFLLLAAYVPFRLIVALRDRNIFAAVCLIAVSAFMLKAIVFGATFAVSSNIVWGFGVALLLAASLSRDQVAGTRTFAVTPVHTR